MFFFNNLLYEFLVKNCNVIGLNCTHDSWLQVITNTKLQISSSTRYPSPPDTPRNSWITLSLSFPQSFGRSCKLGHKHQNPLQLEMLLDIRVVVGECAKVVMPNPLIPTLRKTMRQLVTGWPVKKSLSNVTLLLISWLAYNVLWVNNDRICLPPLLGCRPLFPYLNTKAFMLWNIKRLWLERAFMTSKPASK